MFVILCYDVGIKRNAKINKLAKQYLRPAQKSVCEGYITESKLGRLCAQLRSLIDPDEDSVVIYKSEADVSFEKACIGQARKNENFIL